MDFLASVPWCGHGVPVPGCEIFEWGSDVERATVEFLHAPLGVKHPTSCPTGILMLPWQGGTRDRMKMDGSTQVCETQPFILMAATKVRLQVQPFFTNLLDEIERKYT